MKVPRYGVREQAVSENPVSMYAQQIRMLGYAVIPSTRSESQLEELRTRLDALNVKRKVQGTEARRHALQNEVARCVRQPPNGPSCPQRV